MSPAPNEVVPGPVARRVVENVAALRRARGLTREALSERLAAVGRPIRATGLARLEGGRRRVDADDLVALALALDVSPVRLLMPADVADRVEMTDKRTMTWQEAWRWAVGEQPSIAGPVRVSDPRVRAFIRENRPFEDQRAVREAARMLDAREPAPYTAHIRNDGQKTSHRLTYGDEDV